jgi:hypothetical protein
MRKQADALKVCPIPDACLLVMAQRPYRLLGLPETRSLIFLIKNSPDQVEGYLDYLQPTYISCRSGILLTCSCGSTGRSVPLYSHSPVLFIQVVAGMGWDAFKHSSFRLASTAIWVNSYPGNLRCVATSLRRSTFCSTTAWWTCFGVNLASLFRLGRW